MFSHSTQKSNWLFKDANELAELRKKTNSDYIKKQNADVRIFMSIVIQA
jgi:hypothetical protein